MRTLFVVLEWLSFDTVKSTVKMSVVLAFRHEFLLSTAQSITYTLCSLCLSNYYGQQCYIVTRGDQKTIFQKLKRYRYGLSITQIPSNYVKINLIVIFFNICLESIRVHKSNSPANVSFDKSQSYKTEFLLPCKRKTNKIV